MSDNIAHIADSAALVVAAMERELWANGYVQAYETPIRCLDSERSGGSFRGYLWTVTGPPGSDVIFRWAESRGHEVCKDWLTKDFRRYRGSAICGTGTIPQGIQQIRIRC